MDWTYPRNAMLTQDPGGTRMVLGRFSEELGGTPLRGTRFLFDARRMMQATRAIEEAVQPGAGLLVGFQRASRLRLELSRYRRLIESGVPITAFFQDEGTADGGLAEEHSLPRGRLIRVPRDRRRLENQWFLVTPEPAPVALVGYDISPAERIAEGKVTDPGRLFSGFVTDDARIVDSLARHLVSIATKRVPLRASQQAVDAANGTELVAVVTDDGRAPEYARARALAMDLAARLDAQLILYDRSAESLLTDPYPYPDVVGPERLLSRSDLLSLGRMHLVDQLDEGVTAGVETSAWVPPGGGAAGLRECVRRFGPDLVVVPEELGRSSFLDRLRGASVSRYRARLPVPVFVATEAGELTVELGKVATGR